MRLNARTPNAYRWLSAEDATRHALAAYYALCRQADAWAAVGMPASCNAAHQFAQDLAEAFATRLLEQGFQRYLPGFPPGMAEYFQRQTSIPDLAEMQDQVREELEYLEAFHGESKPVSGRVSDIHRAQLGRCRTSLQAADRPVAPPRLRH
ncbi:MAG: hypothetical protein KGI90_09210 [Burkholderiales bacterium]|nr:hypothetical protein [Burkholderiales bacterium]